MVLTLEEIKKLDKKYYMNTFGDRTDLCFTSGSGITLKNIDGKEYKDFFAGIAVSSLGHGHARLSRELSEQAQALIHTSSVYYIENQAKLAEVLVENTCADKAFFCSTGAEANEGALKLAKKYFYNKGLAERIEFITLSKSFHGRTLATVAATGQPKYQKPYAPLLEKFIHVDMNDEQMFLRALSDRTAGVIIELIQGESGVHPLDREYAEMIREKCSEMGIPLIIDEVQTGVGRCGALFAHEVYGIKPDIFTVAKGLGAGVPIGAILAKEQFASAFSPGDHGTTFGGNPLSTRAGLVVMSELLEGGLLKKANGSGKHLGEKLESLAKECSAVCCVRGMGLMRGVELSEPIAAQVTAAMREKGFLVGNCGTNTLRIVPPLIVTKQDIDEFIAALKEVIQKF